MVYLSLSFVLFSSYFPFFFFFNDTATTEIYTLSLHDALPISSFSSKSATAAIRSWRMVFACSSSSRSEEHTSELQSRQYLVCRLLLEKKKNKHSRMDERKIKKKDNSEKYTRDWIYVHQRRYTR